MTLPLVWLADAIRAEGATVEELPGWETYTKSGAFTPVGLIDHHTAGSSILVNYPLPPFWKPDRLQPVCNITIQPDGIVWTLNAGRAWDSGNGDKHVLAAVKADIPASRPTDTYDSKGKPAGPNPGISGNRWFIDIEVQHRGDGGPIAPVQYEALIQTNAAILGHEDWGENQLIGHRGWSRRKPDPRWNGSSDPMPHIRIDTNERLDMGLSADDLEAIRLIVNEELNDKLGATIAIPDEPNRETTQGLVNAWHAHSQGRKLFETLDEARNFAKEAAEHPTMGPQ